MKTIIKEINVYSFNELTEDAKQNAFNKLSIINVEYNWWSSTYDEAKQIGLQIESFDLDRNRHATGSFLLAANEVAANIFKEHGEECETYKTATNFMQEWTPIFNTYFQTEEGESELMEIEEQFLKNLLEDYSIMLQNICYYLQTEDAIIDTIEANEFEFTEDGEIF